MDNTAKPTPVHGGITSLNHILGDALDNLTAALDLARRGIAVFPVRDWGDSEGWKPIKDFPDKASSDPAQFKAGGQDGLKRGLRC